MQKAEIAVRVANTSRVRAFARACGYEAKTDPRDAQVLSRYGQVFPESDTSERDPKREELQDLLRRRRQLVEQRVQEVNRLDKGTYPGVAGSTKRHIAWLETEIVQLEREYQEALQSNSRLAQRAALYRTVPGVGPLTAATLVAFLPELGQWDSKALTSLVGLAPWSRDSGRKRGQRAVRGGRGGSPQSPVSLCLFSDLGGRRTAPFLSEPATAREARQCGLGGGDAQAIVATERFGPPRNAMGAVGGIGGSLFITR